MRNQAWFYNCSVFIVRSRPAVCCRSMMSTTFHALTTTPPAAYARTRKLSRQGLDNLPASLPRRHSKVPRGWTQALQLQERSRTLTELSSLSSGEAMGPTVQTSAETRMSTSTSISGTRSLRHMHPHRSRVSLRSQEDSDLVQIQNPSCERNRSSAEIRDRFEELRKKTRFLESGWAKGQMYSLGLADEKARGEHH